jgi:methyl-accepting chemotaxis protein
MTVGRPITQSEFNTIASSIAASLFDTMDNIAKVKAVLDGMSTGDLTALGYTSDEAGLLKSAFNDMEVLRQVFTGASPQASAFDFRTFPRRLLGVGIY